MSLVSSAQKLSHAVGKLRFPAPVTHVYNPLDYAWEMHRQYLERYGAGKKRILFLGMNPGPFGMVQTGIPFGEIAAVRDFLKLDAAIRKPAQETPFRPIDGMACKRSEVSGARLWGLFAERHGTAEAFFKQHFVANYCPLAFLENARNVTPDKLPKAERSVLDALCNQHLAEMVDELQPEWVIGVGKYARKQAETALRGHDVKFGDILHPSPASPAANKGWAPLAAKQLQELGVWP